MALALFMGMESATVFAAGADNVYVGPVNGSPSDIVMSDWMPIQAAPYTYWATQNWNQGAEGGGYAGFQQDNPSTTNPRRLHFSIWDPINSTLPITSKYALPGATVSTFGGEGTGLKTMTPYTWELNQWYRMVIRTWNEGCTGTCFGQWIKDVQNNKWQLVAIMDHPVASINLHGGLGLFQEDWAGTAQNVREGRTKNGYNRKLDGTWNSWSTQNISSNNVLGNWDGGATNEYIWFKAGGTTTPSITSPTAKTITQPSSPVFDSIQLASNQAVYLNGKFNVSWQMQQSSSPQFKYDIAVYNNAALTGNPIARVTEVKPQAVSASVAASLTAGMTYYVKLTITDIFDRSSSVTMPVTVGSSAVFDPAASYKLINKKSGKVIDVPGSSTNNGTQLIQYLDKASSNQLWSITDTGNGYFKLINKNSGKAMDVYGGANADGTAIIQYDYSGSNNQLWTLIESAPGYFSILSKGSGKAVETQNGSLADNALLVQQPRTNADQQLWSIVQVQ